MENTQARDFPSPYEQALERHDDRRRAGVPTVTMFVGPPPLACRTWRQWAESGARETLLSQKSMLSDLLDEWMSLIIEKRDLVEDAVRFVSRVLNREPSSVHDAIDRMTPHEVEMMVEPMQIGDHPAARLARLILLRRAERRSAPLSAVKIATACASPDRHEDWDRSTVEGLGGLIGAEATPTVILRSPFEMNSVEWLSRVSRTASALATACPWLAVAITAEPQEYDRWLATERDSFTSAMLRENVVRIAALPSSAIQARLADRLGTRASELSSSVELLASAQATDVLADRLADVVAAGPDVPLTKQSEKSPARSAAERFLFEFFEHYPQTTGLFALNARPGFDFGGRPAELDLACLHLKLAIELDGFYHFQSPDNYRRDRRKDFELQRRGILVLRFLAEDVLGDLQTIRDTVLEAVALQRRCLGEPGDQR